MFMTAQYVSGRTAPSIGVSWVMCNSGSSTSEPKMGSPGEQIGHSALGILQPSETIVESRRTELP
jgi:hypothetical protein